MTECYGRGPWLTWMRKIGTWESVSEQCGIQFSFNVHHRNTVLLDFPKTNRRRKNNLTMSLKCLLPSKNDWILWLNDIVMTECYSSGNMNGAALTWIRDMRGSYLEKQLASNILCNFHSLCNAHLRNTLFGELSTFCMYSQWLNVIAGVIWTREMRTWETVSEQHFMQFLFTVYHKTVLA